MWYLKNGGKRDENPGMGRYDVKKWILDNSNPFCSPKSDHKNVGKTEFFLHKVGVNPWQSKDSFSTTYLGHFEESHEKL